MKDRNLQENIWCPRLIPVAILLFFYGFYLFTAQGIISSADGIINFLTVRALVETGSFSLEIDCDSVQRFVQKQSDGHCYGKYDPGLALTSLPLYLVGRLLSGPASVDYEALSLPRLIVGTLNQLVTAATCAVLYLIASYLSASRRQAVEFTFLFGLTTLAWPYALTYFSQPLVGLLLVTAVYQLIAYSHNKFALFIAGLALGWACITRFDALPLVFVITIYASYKLRESSKSRPSLLIQILPLIAPILLAIFTYLVLNEVRSGSLLQMGYTGEGWTGNLWQGAYGLLLSPGRGVVFYSPLVLLAIPGFLLLWRGGWQAEVTLIVTLALIQIVMYALWWTWDGGWVWGPRFLVSTQPLFLLGIVPWLDNGWGKRLLMGLATVGFAFQIIGATTSPLVYLARTDFTYSQTLYNLVASPILGQLQDLLNRRVNLLIPSRAHGVLDLQQTLLWGLFCIILMTLSGWFLRRAVDESAIQID